MRKKKLKGRLRRLEKAPAWIAERNGKPNNMLRRYKRYFGVDWECAIAELNSLGLVFDPDYLVELRVSVGQDLKTQKVHTPITRIEFDNHRGIEPTSNEQLAFIAGYTSGVFPYGVTWEEMEQLNKREQADQPF
jgi:hypothetical protein